MGMGLSAFARRFLISESDARAELKTPVLVWEAPDSGGESDDSVLTKIVSELEDALVGGEVVRAQAPTSSEPLVFPLDPNTARASVTGEPRVLLGRTDENDIPIADTSVSRVHASFARDAKSGHWKITDLGSTNGTWLGKSRLAPNQAALITDRARLRFGNIELVFYTPPSFFDFLQSMIAPAPDVPVGVDVPAPDSFVIGADELDAFVDFYLQAVRAVPGLEEKPVARRVQQTLRRLSVSAEKLRR